MREYVVENEFVKAVRKAGGVAYKLTSQTANGLPDRLVLFFPAKTIFVELKAPGKKVKADSLQAFWGKELQRLGFRWHEVSTTEEARRLAADLGKTSREITGETPGLPGKEVSRGG